MNQSCWSPQHDAGQLGAKGGDRGGGFRVTRHIILAILSRQSHFDITILYMFMYIHTCMHACIHTSMHTYIHTHIHAYIHTYIDTCMHACIHAYMHTCIPTSLPPYMPTYLPPYMPIYNNRPKKIESMSPGFSRVQLLDLFGLLCTDLDAQRFTQKNGENVRISRGY